MMDESDEEENNDFEESRNSSDVDAKVDGGEENYQLMGLEASDVEEDDIDDLESGSYWSESAPATPCSTSLPSSFGSRQHGHGPVYIGWGRKKRRMPWLEDIEHSPLLLPESSDDLLIDRKVTFAALECYETLRRFGRIIQLSPFRLEDFCAALVTNEQSRLLAEIHMALLKACIRADDAAQITLGANEFRLSIDGLLNLMDPVTWSAVLQQYLNSDERFPECNINAKVTFLLFKC